MRPTLALAIVPLVLSGCVAHVARVGVPPEGSATAVGTRVRSPQAAPVAEVSAQPREVPVSAWRRDDAGAVQRAELVVRTPRPWWQRFPCDLVTDALLPAGLVVATSATPAPTVVAAIPADRLADHARAAGYAAPAP